MNILFMGTPEFAVESLRTLVEASYNVVGAVTQPDKPKGRKMILSPPPVKEYAIKEQIPVYQPNTLKDSEFAATLDKINPDIIIVVAYGKILPEYILNRPQFGCVNVHASLLPKYRGAAPINAAIMNGDTVTGITTQYMAKGIDTGDILLAESIDIDEDETAGELHDRLMMLGGKVLIRTLQNIKSGTITRTRQDNSIATHVSKIDNDMCKIDWTKSSIEIKNQVRALSPIPGAYTYIDGKKTKLFGCRISHCSIQDNIGVTDNRYLTVKTRDGAVMFEGIQVEGAKLMPVSEYIKGHKIKKIDDV